MNFAKPLNTCNEFATTTWLWRRTSGEESVPIEAMTHSQKRSCEVLRRYPCDESLHVSHETIYRSLFIQARGALKKELLEHLRRTR